MKHAICITLLCVVGVPVVLAGQGKDKDVAKAAHYQEMLARKECKTGTPVLKEVRKTVMKTVAGRMIPTAVREMKVVCG